MEEKKLLIGGHIAFSTDTKGVGEDDVFQCFMHNRQAHYTSARVNSWKSSAIRFSSTTPRMVHASYVTVPWSTKPGTGEKSIDDIRYTMQAANIIGIQYLNVHLSKELHLVSGFEGIIQKCLTAATPPCTLLFENVGNLPATSIRLALEGQGLKTPIQKLKQTGQVIEKIATPMKVKWGFTFDTAHGFVTGQRLTTEADAKAFIADAEGVPILALHLNGSLSTFNSGKDLHARTMAPDDQIRGKDHSGLKTLLAWAKSKGIFMILERPNAPTVADHKKEIEALTLL
jgi:deoxyribonuclease-4